MPGKTTVYYKAKPTNKDEVVKAEPVEMFTIDARAACRDHPDQYTKHNPDAADADAQAKAHAEAEAHAAAEAQARADAEAKRKAGEEADAKAKAAADAAGKGTE